MEIGTLIFVLSIALACGLNIYGIFLIKKGKAINLEKEYQQEQQKQNLINEINKLEKKKDDLEQKLVSEMLEKTTQMNLTVEREIQEIRDNADCQIVQIQDEVTKEKQELAKIKQIRIAATQAIIREKKIKEEKEFYSLSIDEVAKRDIEVLEQVKPKLANPRILSMLIWKTYYQKPMTTLCNNVIGTTKKSGIYKITNMKDNLCYIGQAVDLATRYKDHAKCGLGIDTPQGNKLYKAMIEDGLYNFTFEVLEECSRDLLNEREKYYIELYDSKNYGYNSVSGIGKRSSE